MLPWIQNVCVWAAFNSAMQWGIFCFPFIAGSPRIAWDRVASLRLNHRSPNCGLHSNDHPTNFGFRGCCGQESLNILYIPSWYICYKIYIRYVPNIHIWYMLKKYYNILKLFLTLTCKTSMLQKYLKFYSKKCICNKLHSKVKQL